MNIELEKDLHKCLDLLSENWNSQNMVIISFSQKNIGDLKRIQWKIGIQEQMKQWNTCTA